MRARYLLPVLLVLALVGGAPALGSSQAPSAGGESGGIGIGLIDIPSAAQDDPRARRYIIDNLPLGTSISRRVQVTNGTSEAQDVALYAASARIADGVFSGDPRGATDDLAGWTSLDRPEIRLEPGAQESVVVTIDIPHDAPEGEQYAAVWAEITSTDSGETITTASRAGIRMYISVAPGNGPAADFTLGAVTASRTEDGRAVVTAEVSNSGGRALDLTGELRLSDGPSGLSAGPFSTEQVTTLVPGTSGRLAVELGPDIPDGPWRAELTATSGLLKRDLASTLTFPEAGGSRRVAADGPLWVIPAGIAVLVAAGAAVLLLRRRTRTRGRRSASTV